MNEDELFELLGQLPTDFVFDPAQLSGQLRTGRAPSAFTDEDFERALYRAADAGLLRDIEIRPGVFTVARTGKASDQAIDPGISLAAVVKSDIPQPSDTEVSSAKELSPGATALRRAILSPDQFVWDAESYQRLLAATQERPR